MSSEEGTQKDGNAFGGNNGVAAAAGAINEDSSVTAAAPPPPPPLPNNINLGRLSEVRLEGKALNDSLYHP